MKHKKLTNEQMNGQNWRYRKKQPPVDEFASMNGPVKVTKVNVIPPIVINPKPIPTNYSMEYLQPFRCSKCEYVAKDRIAFNEHYSLEH